ncbi:perilipin-1-like isoform X1 [Polyodon spathula]|uniref:perilipin-1-like isoform X1 n=1 Tax=Polyodon spathula TaxID=7913 RepID=UPI001B7F1742|nr:perilipin-1-like isoform X1 [Polyodon spathula]
MATERTSPVQKDNSQMNVFGRLFELPVVSATYSLIQKTYSSTKQTHPIVCTVCEVYEKGAKTATSLAVWSIQPALHRLEPQFIAANNLACKGLDRLEDKIPALQYPPEKLASGIAEVVTNTVTTAKNGITSPIASTSDRALHLAASGYEQTVNMVTGTIDYIVNTRPAKLAAEGVDVALTITEKLVNYILPESQEEQAKVASKSQGSDVAKPVTKPSSYRRLGTLASTVCRRAYEQTANKLHQTRTQGQELVMWIPGVSPLTGLALKNLEVVGSILQSVRSSVSGLLWGWQGGQSAKDQRKREGKLPESNEALSVVTNLGQQLQSAYVSVMSSVEGIPAALWKTVGELRQVTPSQAVSVIKDRASSLGETLGTLRDQVVKNVSHYILLPGLSIKEKEEDECQDNDKESPPASPAARREETGGEQGNNSAPGRQSQAGREDSSPPDISDTSKLVQQKVLEQIPVQQRILLGKADSDSRSPWGSGYSYRETSSSRMGEKPQSEVKTSTYTRSVHSSAYSTVKKD